MLDREIGDAAPGIQPVRGRKRVRRADVEAGAAGTAMVGLGRIRLQIGGGVDRAEQQPVAVAARQQHGVLALPAEAGGGGQRLLHHRGGVAEHLHPYVALGREVATELLQPTLHDLVIVAPLGISRDRTAILPREQVERIGLGPVIRREHDDAAHPRPQGFGRRALICTVLHPAHGAVRAVAEPCGEAIRQSRHRIGARDANVRKTEVAGAGLDEAAQLCAREGAAVAQKSRSA